MPKLTIRDFIQATFTDTTGKISSKRIVTFISFNLVATAFLADLIFNIAMNEFVYNGMLYVVAGGLGFTTLEHFSPALRDANRYNEYSDRYSDGADISVGIDINDNKYERT